MLRRHLRTPTQPRTTTTSAAIRSFGIVVQLARTPVIKQEVVGSSPANPAILRFYLGSRPVSRPPFFFKHMRIYLIQFITVAVLHFLALMSPGPDFIMVTRNSLSYSRKVGILTALGLSLGMVVHVTYSLVGLAYIISQSVII